MGQTTLRAPRLTESDPARWLGLTLAAGSAVAASCDERHVMHHTFTNFSQWIIRPTLTWSMTLVDLYNTGQERQYCHNDYANVSH
ncbi:hypothetical protein BJV74DRAFT_483432 [Russula compacta]|nr:hypothetical protein BJV74DRAFT_483432 [Russula compacta]